MRLCVRLKRHCHMICNLVLMLLTIFIWLTKKVPSDILNSKLSVKDLQKEHGLNVSITPTHRHGDEKIRHSVDVHRMEKSQYHQTTTVRFNKTHDEHLKYLKMEKRKTELRAAFEERKRIALHMPANAVKDIPDDSSEIEKYYNLSRVIISPIDYTFLLSPSKLCSKKPFMVVLVPSATENAELRRAIRSTYWRFGRDRPVHSVTRDPVEICSIFVIGLSGNKTLNKDIRQEFHDFKDIVLADFVDSYYNLTMKVLLGLKWIRDNCPDVQYVLKADDDVFVNIPLLVSKLIRHAWDTNGLVFGTLFSEDLQIANEGKWAINKNEYPLRHYPPYVQGTSYTLTGNLVGNIVNTAQYLPYLHIEDAFITGIIAHKIHGARHVHIHRNSNWGDPKPKPCMFVLRKRVAQTKMSPRIMLDIWDYLNKPLKCSRHYNESSMTL